MNMEDEKLVKMFNHTLKRRDAILFFLIVVINGLKCIISNIGLDTCARGRWRVEVSKLEMNQSLGSSYLIAHSEKLLYPLVSKWPELILHFYYGQLFGAPGSNTILLFTINYISLVQFPHDPFDFCASGVHWVYYYNIMSGIVGRFYIVHCINCISFACFLKLFLCLLPNAE